MAESAISRSSTLHGGACSVREGLQTAAAGPRHGLAEQMREHHFVALMQWHFFAISAHCVRGGSG